MNGDTTLAPRSSNGREARSRKKKVSSGNGGGVYEDAMGDSGDSIRRNAARSDRAKMRKKRVHKSRSRKNSGGRSSNSSLCVIGTVIFALYMMVCLIFFRNLPGGDDENARGMRGLVRRTKEKVSQFRAKHFKAHGNEVEEVQSEIKEEVPVQKSPIPVGLWPVSIRDEDGKFEEIVHPGFDDGHVKMSVPSFWAEDPVAIHENKLMSRERALSIGTCITPDPDTGSNTRGDKCPLNERTVFVAIASYRDWQCVDTVTSIFEAAAHPERVRVGVVDQIVDGEDGSCDIPHSPCAEDPDQPICLHKNQIDVYQMDAELAVGPVFARHIGQRLYRGEYYAMQSDAHVTFTKGWDVDIIEQMEGKHSFVINYLFELTMTRSSPKDIMLPRESFKPPVMKWPSYQHT